MTHRKIAVCAFVRGSLPQTHDKRQHDHRPDQCRNRGCFGLLTDCEYKIVIHVNNRDDIRKMIGYLKKLKLESGKD